MNKNKTVLFVVVCIMTLTGIFIPVLGPMLNISEQSYGLFYVGSVIGFIILLTILFVDKKTDLTNSIAQQNVKVSFWPSIWWIILSLPFILNFLWLPSFFKDCKVGGFEFIFACLFGWYTLVGGIVMIIGFVILSKGISKIIIYFKSKK